MHSHSTFTLPPEKDPRDITVAELLAPAGFPCPPRCFVDPAALAEPLRILAAHDYRHEESLATLAEQIGRYAAVPDRRAATQALCLHAFYRLEDIAAAITMPQLSLLSPAALATSPHVTKSTVYLPDEGARFVHESAVVAFHGMLFAAWYSCPQSELSGYTPICCKRSTDGGQTWGPLETVAEDKSERILYCPPVFGIENDRLYMFVNQMVAPDHMHALDLYVFDEQADRFKCLWSRPIPFKLNTNVVTLPNGKRLLPGRIAELDGFPNTPAVLISDSGHIDSEWRLVKVAENGDLPLGKRLIHPETTVICADNRLYMFSRNDESRIPLVYLSEDNGEHWSAAHGCDLPFVSSKPYGGTISDGRHYLIVNTDKFNRSRMEVFFTDTASLCFSQRVTLFDDEPADVIWGACHYPAAWEADGRLYITATVGYADFTRGITLFTLECK